MAASQRVRTLVHVAALVKVGSKLPFAAQASNVGFGSFTFLDMKDGNRTFAAQAISKRYWAEADYDDNDLLKETSSRNN